MVAKAKALPKRRPTAMPRRTGFVGFSEGFVSFGILEVLLLKPFGRGGLGSPLGILLWDFPPFGIYKGDFPKWVFRIRVFTPKGVMLFGGFLHKTAPKKHGTVVCRGGLGGVKSCIPSFFFGIQALLESHFTFFLFFPKPFWKRPLPKELQ